MTVRLIVRARDRGEVVRELTRRLIRRPALFSGSRSSTRPSTSGGATPPSGSSGHLLAARGDWAGALADFEAALGLNPSDHAAWYMAAPIYLQLGDRPGYRRHCRAMLDRFGATTNALIAERTAKACPLDSKPPAEPSLMVALAERSLAIGPLPVTSLFPALPGHGRVPAGRPGPAAEWLVPLTGQGHAPNCEALAEPSSPWPSAPGPPRPGPRPPGPGLAEPPVRPEGKPRLPLSDPLWHDRLMGSLWRRAGPGGGPLDPVFPADPLLLGAPQA